VICDWDTMKGSFEQARIFQLTNYPSQITNRKSPITPKLLKRLAKVTAIAVDSTRLVT